ncbi:hypothetical protein [Microbulbifer hainanensis]|uniref:hypothetical protein n=1 Tax=Microbulbifer hainanensis TaxID=2735675 RepID=UPI00186902A2|nr:hypothetical protein [Microbulbifer hainanensis]
MTHKPLPDLDDKTRFLLTANSYPEGTAAVRLVETHMARVFLTDHFAYKMKKPVRSSYLDFSSLDKRYGVCREELRLNRRLTDDVYLGVVPLRLTAGGLSLGETGTPVEWLVKMRRLPEAASLPAQIERIDSADLAPLLQRLRRFYRDAAPVPITAPLYLEKMREQTQVLCEALQQPELGQDPGEITSIGRSLMDFTRERGELLGGRAAAGPIVEGHGDLRPEHCFLTSPPQVIDCLEFNRNLRCVDPLDELCYLALECELLGREDLAATVLVSCGALPAEPLVHFYKCYRAFLRAQLAAAHLQDGDVAEPDKWRAKTRTYLDAAARYRP